MILEQQTEIQAFCGDGSRIGQSPSEVEVGLCRELPGTDGPSHKRFEPAGGTLEMKIAVQDSKIREVGKLKPGKKFGYIFGMEDVVLSREVHLEKFRSVEAAE